MFDLRIHEFNSEQEKEDFLETLNKETKWIMKRAFEDFAGLCENDNQKKIFTDWWHGECVSTEEYKARFSEEDDYKAHSVILHACSMGFG
ncbi:hypothetical protein D3C74_430700 [compost metagenome]